jgi:hypothetical protein
MDAVLFSKLRRYLKIKLILFIFNNRRIRGMSIRLARQIMKVFLLIFF